MHTINIKHTHTYIIQIYDKKRDTHKHSLFYSYRQRDQDRKIEKRDKMR